MRVLQSLSWILLLQLCCAPASFAVDQVVDQSERIADAEALLAQAKSFQLKVDETHKLQTQQTQRAKTLKGSASQLYRKSKTLKGSTSESGARTAKRASISRASLGLITPKTGPNLEQAAAAYEQHVNQFLAHTSAYQKHLDAFQKQVGACSEADEQFLANMKRYEAHVGRYHVPGLERPHICPRVISEEELVVSAERGFNASRTRALKAEESLAAQERKLYEAEKERFEASKSLLQDAGKMHLADTVGKELDREYKRLAKEYELLKIERESLSRKRH